MQYINVPQRFQRGETVQINFLLEMFGNPVEIDALGGNDMAVGVFQDCDKTIFKKSNGEITSHIVSSVDYGNVTYYTVIIPHSVTEKFIGSVNAEVSVYKDDGSLVYHSDRIIRMIFEDRKINEDIDNNN